MAGDRNIAIKGYGAKAMGFYREICHMGSIRVISSINDEIANVVLF